MACDERKLWEKKSETDSQKLTSTHQKVSCARMIDEATESVRLPMHQTTCPFSNKKNEIKEESEEKNEEEIKSNQML